MAKQYGDWSIVTQLGEGGLGHVFKVQHTKTGQFGALKRLKSKKRFDRLQAEVVAIMKLDHPNIVSLLDVDLEADEPFVVFEYEPGGTLGDLSPEELLAIPLDQRLMLCEQICDGLKAAHKAGLIHRDVKPDNILLSNDRNTAKLCDFGLVYCDDGGERQTETMEQVGSRYYIPPELEDGRADAVTAASDIYSMGKVLYYAVSGKIFAREQFRKPQYDLASVFDDPYLEAISRVLDLAVATDPESREKNAGQLSVHISSARRRIRERCPIAGVEETYRCVFCGSGTYKEVCWSDGAIAHNNGYKEGNIGNEQFVFLECDTCGNCQRFKMKYGAEHWFPRSYGQQQSRNRM